VKQGRILVLFGNSDRNCGPHKEAAAMLKLTLKLVLLAAVLAVLASFLGGWKWGSASATSQPDVHLIADADGWTWD
jgi:hypothetical protein